jgi:hypothetical protein
MISVKKTLEDANRYDQVIGILQGIQKDEKLNKKCSRVSYYPFLTIHYIWKDKRNITGISSKKIIDEAEELEKRISEDTDLFSKNQQSDEFESLIMYIESKIRLHVCNNMMNLSNRKDASIDIDNLRAYLILFTLLAHVNKLVSKPWEIKDAWKRLPEDEQ